MFTLSKEKSYIDIGEVGWDYRGISSLNLLSSDTRSQKFGQIYAALGQTSFTQEQQLIGLYGSQSATSQLITSLGFITFDVASCGQQEVKDEVAPSSNNDWSPIDDIQFPEEWSGEIDFKDDDQKEDNESNLLDDDVVENTDEKGDQETDFDDQSQTTDDAVTNTESADDET